jgi:spore germination protein KC
MKELERGMERRHHVRLTVLLAMAALGLAGCWDRKELDDLAIAVGMGFDQAGKQVRVTTQIVNPGEVASSKKESGYTTPVTSISMSGATTFEAIRKISTASPRKIFSSHLRVLVIGEELARQGVTKIVDGISRNHEFRSDFYILVAQGTTAAQILNITTPIDKIPGNKMFESLEKSERLWAPTVTMQLDQFMSDLSNPAKATTLTAIRVIGDAEAGGRMDNVSKVSPAATLQYAGQAILKNGRFVDWMNEEESKGYNYIMGHVQNSAEHISCLDGGVMSVEDERTNVRIKGKVVRGQPKITVDLFAEESIAENQCSVDVTKPQNITMLEQIAEEKLGRIMEEAIRKAQKNKADIFGFGDAIEDVNPKAWLKLRENWDSRFADLDVKVNVDIQIRRFGTTNNSLLAKKEK